MAIAYAPHPAPAPLRSDLSVVLCGSFRRLPAALKALHDALSASFSVLSPTATDFTDSEDEFVRLPQEVGESVAVIEERHLAAIRSTDFVWLFCPDGYVGHSASMELGYANAIGTPILSSEVPTDPLFRTMTTTVESFESVPSLLSARRPGAGLGALQNYYARVATKRGWDSESPRDTLLLMMEEIGELSHAIRKDEGLRRDEPFRQTMVGSELADVQLYLVHLANVMGIDLAEMVTAKERSNAERFDDRSHAA